jgi:predicted membrane-bound spermidine synthase
MLSVHAIGLFSLLGIGFMAGELSLLARFTLLFGSPSIAMAVFLSALLGWAGLGSWVSRRWRPGAPEQRIRAACLAIVPIMAGYAALLPWALFRLAPLDDAWRLLACVCLLMPIGIIAGVPFPSAVQWLKNLGRENLIPWMYGINGVSSVAGSALSLLVATSFGFQQALLASAACYLLIYFLMRIACEQGYTKLKAKNRAMAIT